MKRIPALDIFRGIVRPNVTYALVGAVIAGFFMTDKISGEMVFALTQVVVTFWFVDRQTQKALESNKSRNDSE